MDDRFETTFVVDIAIDEAWGSLTRRPGCLPAFESNVEVLQSEAPRLLRARKTSEPCAGTEIVVTLEGAAAGTRVTVVQSGFGAWFESALNALTVGWSHIVADLALYLERGAAGGRHVRQWATLACGVRETVSGLEVTDVYGGLAESLELQSGDVLLTLAGAPLVLERELHTVLRIFAPGDEVEASWARKSEVLAGKGRL